MRTESKSFLICTLKWAFVLGAQRRLRRLLRTDDALSADTMMARCDGFIEAEIGNEIVALNVERGSCYGLNRVGSRIWGLLKIPVRVSDLCAVLVSEYEVDRSLCERQVLDLLEELRAEGLVAPVREK
jgi:hypothetical protein